VSAKHVAQLRAMVAAGDPRLDGIGPDALVLLEALAEAADDDGLVTVTGPPPRRRWPWPRRS
jgi:hypothetical protein